MRILCSKWPGRFAGVFNKNYTHDLPCPVSAPPPIREHRLKRAIYNIANINSLGSDKWKPDWDMILLDKFEHFATRWQPRRWTTGYEVAQALCGETPSFEHDGLTQEMFAKIAKKCCEYIVLCESSIRGLVVCDWSIASDYVLMDVEMTERPDGSKVVTGYSIVYSSKLRSGFQALRFGSEVDELVGYDECGKFLDRLTRFH